MNDVTHQQLVAYVQMLERLNYYCLYDKVGRDVLSQLVNKNLPFEFRFQLLQNTLDRLKEVKVGSSICNGDLICDIYSYDVNYHYSKV
ncbi:hypothetical protein [Capnocytophaga haemolytica]